MASFTKRDKGWRAQVAVLGVREGKTFATKAEASAWAAMRETEIRTEKATGIQRGRTLGEAFRRYEKEVSAHKEGHRWEAIRLAAIGKMEIDGVALQDMVLADVTSDTLGKWRDHRLKVGKVLGSTVNREFNLISHVFTTASTEWKWIASNPTTGVRRPKDPDARDRLYSDDEINRLCFAMGFDLGGDERAETTNQRVAVAFLFAIETGMRAGEICNLMPQDVAGRVAKVRKSKTDAGRRDVPLSPRAVDLLGLLPNPGAGLPIFGVSAASVDALFRKAKERALVVDATFHDSRHLAVTRLAKKFGILDLARAIGHRDLRQLQVYYNETAENMAKRLDGPDIDTPPPPA
jgi:integrase